MEEPADQQGQGLLGRALQLPCGFDLELGEARSSFLPSFISDLLCLALATRAGTV